MWKQFLFLLPAPRYLVYDPYWRKPSRRDAKWAINCGDASVMMEGTAEDNSTRQLQSSSPGVRRMCVREEHQKKFLFQNTEIKREWRCFEVSFGFHVAQQTWSFPLGRAQEGKLGHWKPLGCHMRPRRELREGRWPLTRVRTEEEPWSARCLRRASFFSLCSFQGDGDFLYL